MTKRKKYYFLVAFLCIPLIFAGCEEPTGESLPNLPPETESESAPVESESAAESAETESESVTEAKESETSNQLCGGLPDPYPFDPFGDQLGVVVRWVDVVGGCTHPDFPKFTRFEGKEFHEFSDMFMVKVEVLDVMDEEGGYGKANILALDTIFVPREAAYVIEEGEEALILLIFYKDRVEGMEEPMLIGCTDYLVEEAEKPLQYIPLFRYEDGRMIIDESQLEKNKFGRYKMRFLWSAFRANEALRRYGANEQYFFRSGMTLDELEQFRDMAREVPWMVLEESYL